MSELELIEDNKRLRALIKDKEFTTCGGDYDDGDGYTMSYDECPWCHADGRHKPCCPAFNPDGTVK